jgi:serine/threonine protein kinase
MHGLLELDPKKRFTAKDALTHKYFDSISPEERLKFGNLTI